MTSFDVLTFGSHQPDLREIVVYCPHPDLPECMFTRKLQDHCYLMTAEQFSQCPYFAVVYYAAVPVYHVAEHPTVTRLHFHPAKAKMYDTGEVRLLDYNEKLSVLCATGQAALIVV